MRAAARNMLADAFSEFFRCYFFDSVFANLQRDLLKISSLFFVFCSFLRFLLQLGSTQPCTCVLGQLALNLSSLFVFCLSVYQKHCFPPEKRVIFVHFSMSHFLSPWFPSLLLFIPCLSLSLVYFLSFLVLLFFLWPFLFFCCSFLPCFFALVSWQQQQHQKIRCQRFLFINVFCFFWVSCFLVSPIPFSYLCFSLFKFCVLVNMNVFVFLSRPFLKHRFLFCILWNIIVFLGAHFVGKIWMMCKSTVKIGISAHC